ncbi:hypothetical protein KHA80_20645 [Anaerobacillus sp. HL2]|nr:hypothetical protein KHA80_20645 [Anaerobacillus sp. HL2]
MALLEKAAAITVFSEDAAKHDTNLDLKITVTKALVSRNKSRHINID